MKELGHIRVTLIIEAVMQGPEETLAEAFELGFQAVNTRIKSAFSIPGDGSDGYDPQRICSHHTREKLRSLISLRVLNERSSGEGTQAPSAGKRLG